MAQPTYVSYFCVTCPLSQPHTPFLSTSEFLVCCPPSGILTWHSSTCQGSIFSLVSFGSFLSSICPLEEKWARHPSLASQIVFSLLGLHFRTTHIHLYLVPTLLLATCLGCCLSFMCDSSTLAEVTLLFPPPQYDVASLGHFSFSLQHQELSSWEAIYGSPVPSTVCSLLSIKRRAEHSVFWALRVTGLPPPQHCGCLSIHAMHLSLRRPEPPLTCLVLLSVCLEQICSCQFPALPSCPFSVSFHHLSQEPKRRKEEREVHNCRIRLIRFRLHPFCLLHGVCLSIWCGARWG